MTKDYWSRTEKELMSGGGITYADFRLIQFREDKAAHEKDMKTLEKRLRKMFENELNRLDEQNEKEMLKLKQISMLPCAHTKLDYNEKMQAIKDKLIVEFFGDDANRRILKNNLYAKDVFEKIERAFKEAGVKKSK